MKKVFFKYVLIKPKETAGATDSGFIVPENVLEKPHQGEVLQVGEEVTKVKPGDLVLYKKWGGNEFKEDGEDRLLIEDVDIFGLV